MNLKSIPLIALSVWLLAGCGTSEKIREPLPHVNAVRSPEFRQAMGSLIPPGFVPGNGVRTLSNGQEIFPAMLAAIRGARQTVNFETFIFSDGEIPKAFAEALAERARAGVEVRVILDANGAKKSRPLRPAMVDAGVKLKIYNSLASSLLVRYNYRTHRKLLIVDGKIGFIGGVGIADEWNGNARSPKEWRDLHFRVEGPVVAQLQGAFYENWYATSQEVLQGAKFFPVLRPAGPLLARCFISSPAKGGSTVELMYHLAIASAQQTLLIENAYFLPDNALVEALCAAARRGVKVKIMMPGKHIDQKAVRRASRKRWGKLLQAGVELYEYQPTMVHTKLLIADGLFVSVGSANLDPRSLRINDEANLTVLDAGFAKKLSRLYQEDLGQSARVTDAGHGLGSIVTLPVSAAQTPLESQL